MGSPSFLTIRNCYDSHTHFEATGQVASGLRLEKLKSKEDLRDLVLRPEYHRSDWVMGFGWNQNFSAGDKPLSIQFLDTIFPNQPVFFSRADGHVSWVNSVALKRLQNLGFEVDAEILRSGLLFEQDHFQALSLLPSFTVDQSKSFFIKAQSIFNQAGFTHLRDLSMNLNSWSALCQLDDQKKLSVCLDAFVTAQNLNQLDQVLNEVSQMKSEARPFLRVHGVKIFVDGSLGAKTAYLSENYVGTDHHGRLTWPLDDVESVMRKVWSLGLELAVHTIGDQAAHVVALAARKVSAEGHVGRLHLEHVEVLRPETVQVLKPLHVTAHIQPCHWLSDRMWLDQVLPKNLHRHLFPWELLRKNKIGFYFGSDSPIEVPSLFTNQLALKQSAEKGIPVLQGDWQKHHTHPDLGWTNSWTELNTEEIQQVYFDGRPLL